MDQLCVQSKETAKVVSVLATGQSCLSGSGFKLKVTEPRRDMISCYTRLDIKTMGLVFLLR